MKYTVVKLAMIIASGLLLNGCENSDYTAASCTIDKINTQPTSIDCTVPQGAIIGSSEPAPEQEVDSTVGLQGKVFDDEYWVGAEVCFDNNQNGICDTNLESSVLTNEQGQYVLTQNVTRAGYSNGTPLIATLNNQLMSASPIIDNTFTTSNTANISPFTSLVVNEMLFNTLSFQNRGLAMTALGQKKFILASPELLAGENFLLAANTNSENTAFISSFKNAQAAFNQQLKAENNYSVMAALFNRMIENSNFTINLDPAEIANFNILNDIINTQLSTQLTTWEKNYEDERSRTISTQGDLAIIGSKWHNRLILIDTSSDGTANVISSALFAFVEGGQDAIDAFSGATEQLLQDIDISPDNRNVFVTIKKATDSSKDVGTGIYRADIFLPQEIEEIEFASISENTTNYYAFADINNSALSSNGEVLALASEKREIALLNANTLAEQSILNLDSKVRTIALNDSGEQIFAGLSRSARTGISSINSTTEEEQDFVITTGYPTDLQVIDNNKLAASFYKETTLSIFDISDSSNIFSLKNITASDNITSFSLSNNGKFAAIAMSKGRIELFELIPSIRLIETINSKDNENINDISFTKDNILLISIKNAIQSLTLTIDPVNNS